MVDVGAPLGASLAAVAALGLAAAPAALAAPGVSVSSVSSLKAGATAGTLSGTVVNDSNRATRAKVVVRLMRRGTNAPVVGRTAVNVAAHGSAAYSVGVKLPSGLKRGNYYLSSCTQYGSSDSGQLGCATAQRRRADQGRHPGARHARRQRAGPGLAGPRLQRGRAHAGQARLAAVPGDRQHRLQQPAHRRQPDLRRADEPLPAGHERRPPAARDAVPDRVQPRLRAHEHVTPARRRHGPEPDASPRSRSTASPRPSRSSSRPTRATRTARTIPTRWRTRRRTRTRSRDQPEPARVRADRHRRRAAGRAVPGEQARDHALGADPGRHRLQGRRQLHGPPGRPRRR